jgi:hypothetical protein
MIIKEHTTRFTPEYEAPIAGNINGTNKQFVFNNEPVFLIVNRLLYNPINDFTTEEDDGYWKAIFIEEAPQEGSSIISLY